MQLDAFGNEELSGTKLMHKVVGLFTDFKQSNGLLIKEKVVAIQLQIKKFVFRKKFKTNLS